MGMVKDGLTTYEWDGKLDEMTPMKVSTAGEAQTKPFATWVAMTNGYVLEVFANHGAL